MLFEGFSNEGEMGFFVKSFKVTPGLFHGAQELRGVPGEEVVKETVEVFREGKQFVKGV